MAKTCVECDEPIADKELHEHHPGAADPGFHHARCCPANEPEVSDAGSINNRYTTAEREAFRPRPCSNCGSERYPSDIEWSQAGAWNGPGDGQTHWIVGIRCPSCTDEAAARVP